MLLHLPIGISYGHIHIPFQNIDYKFCSSLDAFPRKISQQHLCDFGKPLLFSLLENPSLSNCPVYLPIFKRSNINNNCTSIKKPEQELVFCFFHFIPFHGMKDLHDKSRLYLSSMYRFLLLLTISLIGLVIFMLEMMFAILFRSINESHSNMATRKL